MPETLPRTRYGTPRIRRTDDVLSYWAERIAADAAAGHTVYIYFNNDPGCHAIYNAFRLREMLGL